MVQYEIAGINTIAGYIQIILPAFLKPTDLIKIHVAYNSYWKEMLQIVIDSQLNQIIILIYHTVCWVTLKKIKSFITSPELIPSSWTCKLAHIGCSHTLCTSYYLHISDVVWHNRRTKWKRYDKSQHFLLHRPQ